MRDRESAIGNRPSYAKASAGEAKGKDLVGAFRNYSRIKASIANRSIISNAMLISPSFPIIHIIPVQTYRDLTGT
jgi:hypothetical protein